MKSAALRRNVRTPLLVALGTAAAVTLSACGGSGTGSAQSPPTDGRASSATQTASENSGSSTAGSADKPIAAREVTEPAASRIAAYDGERVRIEVLSLKRSGDLSTLQLRESYLGTKYYSIGNDLGGMSSYDLSGITLVDTKNGKRYLTAHDSNDDCVCSETTGVQIKPGSSYTMSATFAAPPDDVTVIDLSIPGLGTISDVPLS